ncbi:MAG: hypothetical protein IJ323_05455 [Clostridia bacterium]|nr:hypothetical protein [Clostridia bacterium]
MITAICSTIASWFIGLVIDANLGSGDYAGTFSLRILFPILVMGSFILWKIEKK